jgi:uncharacterized membrane protein
MKTTKQKTKTGIKSKKNIWLIALGLLALQMIIGIILYDSLPERLYTHWNEHGVADDSMSKIYGVFFLPLFSFLISIILILAPKLDPLKDNITKFEDSYRSFIIGFWAFMFYLNSLTLALNMLYSSGLPMTFNMIPLMVPAFAFITYSIGALLGKAKRNWTIGIRTSWALYNDAVWDRVHARASKILKWVSLITLAGMFFLDWAFLIMIVPLISAMIFSCIDSYVQYRIEIGKDKKKNK